MRPELAEIVKRFRFEGDYLGANPYGTGHINDTFVAHFANLGNTSRRYILQRINHTIFEKPEELMENIEAVTRHLRRKITAAGGDPERETLNLIPTADGGSFHRTEDGNYWRAYNFIEHAQTYEVAENPVHVRNAAKAFGRFQSLLSDFPSGQLNETIPDFHNTRKRFEALVDAVERDVRNRARSVQAEIEFAVRRADDAPVLLDLLEKGELPERVTHNDTKFNNVMIDDESGEGICVIDLDTVMPGLTLYDFGDSVRSAANTAAEDEQDLNKVRFDLGVFEHLAHGYLDAARGFLTPREADYLPFSARIMTLECGVRFLADYLDGDVYFKTHRDSHNLDRCRTQFKMVADMEGSFDQMRRIVELYR